jgi:DNA-binding NtrC family response regulator
MDAPQNIKLLAIDDDPRSLELVSEALSDNGLDILTAEDPEIGLEIVRRERPQIVLSDIVMPHLNGMELLGRVLEIDPATDVVLMTAHYSTEAAVEAIKKGACDYLSKPISITLLRERIEKLATDARRRRRATVLDGELMETCQFEGMVGRSPLMWQMFAQIRRVAPHYRACVITGPTGAGKELIARSLHRLSPVAKGPMVVCNCSAVVETLFESELFGHVKGAFTGAINNKVGLFESAHGGTMFLDEIGDMPLATQAKLLRVLQNQEIQRVGSLTSNKVDVRVVAATNHDLRTLIAERRFREDLYYRLSMVEIKAPPLSERKEDLPLLERFFIQKFSEQYKKQVSGLTPRAEILLARHSWPGNVRELENVIGHACMIAVTDMVDVTDLPQYMREMPAPKTGDPAAAAAATAGTAAPAPPPQAPESELSFDEQERRVIESALSRTRGNQVHAARLLGISRDKLRYKMKKHNLR